MHNFQVEINPWLKILLDDFLEEAKIERHAGGLRVMMRLNPDKPVALLQGGMKCRAGFSGREVLEGVISSLNRSNGRIVLECLFPENAAAETRRSAR